MKLPVRLALFSLPLLAATSAFAADKPFTLTVDGLRDGVPVPADNLLCKPTADGKSAPGPNKRPTLSWEHAPKGTQSFAIIVMDPDVPADFSHADKEGEVLAEDAPRKDLYHWGRVDIPGTVERIPGGDLAVGVGAPASNDLKGYVKDPKSYGGPCPPWNDARIHHYHFKIFALDVKSLGLSTGVTAKQLASKLDGNPHVLAQTEVIGTYTLNPDLR